ncbi:hypothetical protein [Georgenia muralis]
MTGLRALPLESLPPFNQTAPDLVGAADQAQETFRALLLGRSWDLLHSHAATLSGLALALLEHIHARTGVHAYHTTYLAERDAGLAQVYAALAADTSGQADDIRDAMLTQLTAELGDPAAAQAALDALLGGTHPLFDSRAAERSAVTTELDVVVPAYAQTATLAARAVADSGLYKAYDITTALAAGPDQEADTETVTDEATVLRTLHDETVAALFTHLDTTDDGQGLLDLAVTVGERITARLPVSAPLAGAYLALLHQRPATQGALAQHRAVLDVVELLERLQVLLAYARLVQAEMATPDRGRWYGNERRRTENRQSPSGVPAGQPAGAQALRDGTGAEGDLVSVEGLVSGLGIADDPAPPKFSTFFDLTDLDDGASVRVRAHMFSLANNGVQDGAFVRVNGFVRRAAPWAAPVGLDVDRVDLTELRRQSWYDDVTARVRHHALLYPDGMSMFFTPAVRLD